ncbi:hypothetical protein BJX96DRAFT_159639 [Aspergillus floccosus]
MARLPNLGTCQVLRFVPTAIFAVVVWTIWLGVNFDKDNNILTLASGHGITATWRP